MIEIFENDIKKRKVTLSKYNKIADFTGIFKLLIFILICYGAFNIYKNNYPIELFVLLGIEIAIYIAAHIFHKKIFEKINLEKGLIEIDEKNIKRINGEWCEFKDIGEEFENNSHPYSNDLDIVGRKSVFQMLNSTHTYYGRARFAKDLLDSKYLENEIIKRQNSIAELSDNYELSSYLEYLFSAVGMDNSFPELINELQNEKQFIKNKYIQMFLRYICIPTLFLLIFSFLFKNVYAFNIASIMLAFQTILCIIGFSKSRSYVGIMRKLPRKVFRYDDIIKEVISTNFNSEKLNEIKNVLISSQKGMKELYLISNSINQCKIGLAYIILNIFFLVDYKNAINLDNWKMKYSNSIKYWYETLGELESFLSFANLPRACENVVFPKLCEKKNYIEASSLGHPLIDNKKRICNDFVLDNNIYIISGSNMSGKTTFMRTVGINMILAQAGSYVCSSSMAFSNMNIVTSMRIADDLNEGISTFYAELKRIKMIIDSAKSDDNTLFLIDEIFRGTNSIDRLRGAEEVLKELSKIGAVGMITTHDLEVCKLENNCQNILNYSFNENYIEDEIYFDYKLKHGKSQTTNAEYLLKKVGILK